VLSLIVPIALLVATMTWLSFLPGLWKMSALPNLATAQEELPTGTSWPKLSLLVACRNEAANVRAALSSVLAQDYPALEVVAVDDRSEDPTGRILDELAAKHPSLRVVHVTALPDGWLGKTHALARAAEAATGELFLFTDADVVFAPGALRRAVAWMERDRLGHGVALARFVAPGLLERAFVSLFAMFLLLQFELDKLDRAGSTAHVGVGAFNMVRRDAYQSIGGHGRLRLEVADDVKLGLILRRSGVRQGCIDSGGLVRVRWQPGFLATMRGLVKNFFAGADYRWRNMLAPIFGLPVITTFPAICLALPVSPGTRVLAALAFALPAVFVGACARRITGGRGYEGLLVPLAGLALSGTALASAVVTTLRGGVVWRGTLYRLRELRDHSIRAADLPSDRAPGL
jgi:cellulose synthase/poly-beta-1,6-N-acetylglucosamine synthase-like glycosyltransferase